MKIIDMHAHYGKWGLFPMEKNSINDFLRIMRKNEIEISVVSSSLALIYDFKEGNKKLADVLKHHHELLGYLFLNPNYLSQSFKEMDRYLQNEEFIGLGELYDEGYIGSKALNCEGHKRILERLLKKFSQRLVLFHCDGKRGIFQLLEVAKEFPEINFLAGHLGAADRECGLAAKTFRKIKNVYLEICGSSIYRDRIETVVREIGAQRVVFGSDSTILTPAVDIGAVVGSDISREEKEKIFYLNAKDLLFGKVKK